MKLIVPLQLQKITQASELTFDSKTINEFFNDFIAKFPAVKERLLDKKNGINKFINVYVNDEDIRFLEGVNTKLTKADIVYIIPSLAGG